MCSETSVNVIELAPVASSAPRVRRFLEAAHCRHHEADIRERAALLVTELVANAIRHGQPPIIVAVECDETHDLVVRVRDMSPDPIVPRQADASAEDGRGLAIVDILSDEWGVEPDSRGKWVWFRLTSAQRPDS